MQSIAADFSIIAATAATDLKQLGQELQGRALTRSTLMDDTVTDVSAPTGQKQNFLSLTHIQMGRQVVVQLVLVQQDVFQQVLV